MKVKDLEQQKQRLVEQVSNKTFFLYTDQTEHFAFFVDKTHNFSCSWHHVFPRLALGTWHWLDGSRAWHFAPVACFPALGGIYTFYRAWHLALVTRFPAHSTDCKILSVFWLANCAFRTLHVFLASCYHSRFVFTTFNQITIVESVLCCLLTVVFWLGVRSREAISSKGKRVLGLQGTTTDKTWSETRIWNQPFENGKGINYITATTVIGMMESWRRHEMNFIQIIKLFWATTISLLSLLPAGRTWT